MIDLYQQWIDAKQAEKEAQTIRREIEDKLIQQLAIDNQTEGSKTLKDNGYKVKYATRLNRSIDPDLLQEIAAEHGLTHHLGALFRWKPELNVKVWNDADSSITQHLQAAITTKPGRPSFTIETI
jgi:hypothetical protein